MKNDHDTWMDLALAEAEQALAAGEFPVGCVMVHGDRVVAVGGRENSGEGGNEFDHAELVALRRLLVDEPDLERSGIAVYSTLEPCLMCFSALILNGFRTIVFGYEDVMGGGSGLELARLAPLYAGMEVAVVGGVQRARCLALFQRFFRDGKYPYWRDSLLCRHTLAQP